MYVLYVEALKKLKSTLPYILGAEIMHFLPQVL